MSAARYLGQAAIARELGVTRHLVGTWRNRYRNTQTPFPEPDAIVDESDGRDVPGWLPERIGDIRSWRHRPVRGRGAAGSP